ncbi:TetR/AcrR family transcriptional regulator [Streptomyces sp. NPDC058471]|uniref:TetR/AcrR family transcriptional regulator n=1 Tax=Streptomyces sp. NPDC058471 TaxID=3346516 RepID=UPI00366165C5
MTITSESLVDTQRTEAAQALVSAARTLFVERGYRQTSLDDLAGTAGLEPELARALFADKAAVFAALLQRTFKVAGLLAPEVAAGIDDDLPTRLARSYLPLWEPGDEESPLVEVYRIALSDRDASAVLRTCISESLNGQVDHLLPGPDADLRTALFGAHLGGTAIVRHLIGVEVVAAADLETVIETITPALRQTLIGPANSR